MKNKETIIGWVLIVLLMLAFVFYQQKKSSEDAKHKKPLKQTELKKEGDSAITSPAVVTTISTDSSANLIETAPITSTDTSNLQSEYGPFATAATGEEKLFVIENDVEKITLTTKGAQIKSIELKKYKTWDKKPLILFTDKTNLLSYQFFIENSRSVDTKDFYFEPIGESFKVSGDSSKSFTMRLPAGDGKVPRTA